MLNMAVDLGWLERAPRVRKPKIQTNNSDFRYRCLRRCSSSCEYSALYKWMPGTGSVNGRRHGRHEKRRLRTLRRTARSRSGSPRSFTTRWSYTLRDALAQRGQTSNASGRLSSRTRARPKADRVTGTYQHTGSRRSGPSGKRERARSQLAGGWRRRQGRKPRRDRRWDACAHGRSQGEIMGGDHDWLFLPTGCNVTLRDATREGQSVLRRSKPELSVSRTVSRSGRGGSDEAS